MTDILLVRHALCDHVGRRLAGRIPRISLNHLGRRQARRLADALAHRALRAVYTSPLERAVQTAEPIARLHHLQPEKREALTDIDFGAWTGASFRDLADDDHWHLFNTHRSTTRIPRGESMIEVQTRAVCELLGLAALHRGECIALVSHADVIRSMILHLLGMHLDAIHRIEIEPASVTHVRIEGLLPRVISFNIPVPAAAASIEEAAEPYAARS